LREFNIKYKRNRLNPISLSAQLAAGITFNVAHTKHCYDFSS